MNESKRHEDDDGPPYDDARLRKFFCDDGASLGFSAQAIGPRGESSAPKDPDAKLWNKGVMRWSTDPRGPGSAAQHRAVYELVQKLTPETIDVLYRAYGPESACPALALRDNPPARARLGRWRFVLEKTEAARSAFAAANRKALETRFENQEANEAKRRDAIERAKETLVGVQREVTEKDEAAKADAEFFEYEHVDLPFFSADEQAARNKAYDVAMLGGARVRDGEQTMTFAHWLIHRAEAKELRAARKEAATIVRAAWDAWVAVAGAPKRRDSDVGITREDTGGTL
ncbi:MAG: hypothetical protein HOW73_20510 [Polyangiaceae bacterium]|nr:hypothetical protein [Polyangiaceae bacterium]